MRLWSLHPSYLDRQGLVALWREALLAQKVLRGQTRGYKYHPQLLRFRACSRPRAAIASYLRAVHAEAQRCAYRFDAAKIGRAHYQGTLPVTQGQLEFERKHLAMKLKDRDPGRRKFLMEITRVRAHPLFRGRPGAIEAWEMH